MVQFRKENSRGYMHLGAVMMKGHITLFEISLTNYTIKIRIPKKWEINYQSVKLLGQNAEYWRVLKYGAWVEICNLNTGKFSYKIESRRI